MATESFQERAAASYLYICASAAALCLCAPACDRPTPNTETEVATDVQRPNVLIIMWDTVRADRLSAYGYDLSTTPFLEEFARDAALFENVVSPGIWTLPSHASLFTGLPTSAHGATVNHRRLDNGIPRLSVLLTESGYDTYFFSSNPFVSHVTNLDLGFEKIDYSWEAPWAEKTLRHTFGKLDPRDRSNGFSVQLNAKRERTDMAAMALSSRHLTQSGPTIAEAFEQWLGERDFSKPFFGYLNYMEAHFPRIPSMEARRRVMPADLIDDSFTLNQGHRLLMAYMFGQHDYSAHDLAVISAVYDASLVDLDAATNQLIQVLRRKDLLDETAVFIVSDHGENLGEHGLMEHKYCAYNTVTRVPLVLRYPARVSAGRIADSVSLADVFATVLDLAGIDGVDPGPHSLSLLENPSHRPDNRALVSEMLAPALRALQVAEKQYPDLDRSSWERTFRAIESKGQKFIWASDGRHELYDLRNDPDERRNLFGESQESAGRLQAALDSWLASFAHYDAGAANSEEPSTLAPEEEERLKALGY
jgi:arylsulfatase A-like enzyme